MELKFTKAIRATLILAALLTSGCGGGAELTPGLIINDSSSFENDFEGWTPYAIDVGEGGGVVDQWSITRSRDRARDGTTSVKFYLSNNNDAGKIWLEKTYSVQPNRRYQVHVQYAFATQDYGDFNFFTLIAGVLPQHPQTGAALQPAFQGNTHNGSSAPSDFLWLNKSYSLTVQSDSSATLHVVIGVWGTYEVARTYYVDSVLVRIAEVM